MAFSYQDVSTYELKQIKLDKTPRPEQIKLLEFTKESILSNNKFVLLNAATGAGKSFFSVMFMDWFKKNFDISATFDILTNSKLLQEQYSNEFNFMNNLWGIQNYECENYKTDCGTGMEWCRLQNKQCGECPYKQAKWKFDNGDIALTNFHLFLSYMIHVPQAWKRSSRVLIIDECDQFEAITADFIKTEISKPILKKCGFNSEDISKALKIFGNKPYELSDSEFVRLVKEQFISIAKTVMNRLVKELEDKQTVQTNRYISELKGNILNWENLYKYYNTNPDNWVVDVNFIDKKDKTGKSVDKYYEMIAQPVWVYQYLDKYVWSKYDYVIFMSGTILDKELFSKINGIDNNRATYINIDSPFPKDNRPIYYFNNIGKMSYKTKDITWQKMKPVLEKILKKHKNESGIIHTHTYEFQKIITEQINDDRFLSHDSSNRNEVLQLHYNRNEPSVLISPSMAIGIDLIDNYSRHQTIIKMPYPNLNSKKIKKRLETIPEWYQLTTVRELIQMLGRSIRHNEDWAKSYILDGSFGDLLKWNRKYFPNYILEAIHYIE